MCRHGAAVRHQTISEDSILQHQTHLIASVVGIGRCKRLTQQLRNDVARGMIMANGTDKDVPISLQQNYWDKWNASNREEGIAEASRRQGEIVHRWLSELGRTDLRILEVGCGTGWLCRHLTQFGQVTGIDLSERVLERAKIRTPEVTFVPGDFMNLEFGSETFDVIVALEVLSHVADQHAFLTKIVHNLRPGGYLMLATQNRFVLKYLNLVPPTEPGQLRHWVSHRELRALLEPKFKVLELFSVTPQFAHGLGLRRWARSSKLAWPIRKLIGDRASKPPTTPTTLLDLQSRRQGAVISHLEAIGLGWTLMAKARKRVAR